MQDGKGALYFVKPQATFSTPQEWRESSPSGVINMPRMMGRRFTPGFVAYMALASIAVLAAINSMLPPGW